MLISVIVVSAWVYTQDESIEDKWIPNGMKVELLSEPYGINSHNPAFSWYVNGNENGTYQKAYQIVIAKTLHDMEIKNYVTDTGWIESAENTYVKIDNAEKIFTDNSIFWWKVRIMDIKNRISSYSETQCFSMGVGEEWDSLDGIWNQEKSEWCFFRTQFEGDYTRVEKALLSITALSPEETRQYVYNAYLNGVYIGSGPAQLKGDQINYNTYDVTQYLQQKNVFGIVGYSSTQQALLCQLTFFYTDGSKEIIFNSGANKDKWRVLDGNRAYGKNEKEIGTSYYIAHAENIDAREYPHGWLNLNYDDSQWNPPITVKVFNKDKLYAYETENMQKYYIIPKLLQYKGNGHYFVDLGKEIIGGIQIYALGYDCEPATITLHCGEELDKIGNVKYQMRTGNVYEETWTLNNGVQKYENVGMKTFRYVDIYLKNALILPEGIKGVELRQPFDTDKSYFDSSSKLLNNIYNLTKYTIKSTNQNLYVDSQSRERKAYEGDVWINMVASYAFQDNYTLARVSNEYLENERTWPAEYPMYAILSAWQDYLYTGNKDSLLENYDNLKRNMDGVIIDSKCGLVKNNYGDDGFNRPLVDWPEIERDDYKYDEAEYNTVVNAMASYSYGILAKIANTLNNRVDEVKFLEFSDQIKKSMIEYLYTDSLGAFCDGLTKTYHKIDHHAQHATAYALYAGIYENIAMRDQLIAYIKKTGQIKMSVFGAYFLLQGLYDNDAGVYATHLLLSNKSTHTWAYMLKENNATITTEAWSIDIKDNMTYSHPWGAAPAALIVQGIFGIKPEKPGFDEFRIKLQPGNLQRASLKIPTIKGEISCSYQRNKNMMLKVIEVVVPSNSKAKIMIPFNELQDNHITINDQDVILWYENNYICTYLESGSHVINIDIGR